jgi:nucleoside-diphosphate-sugar epimerase
MSEQDFMDCLENVNAVIHLAALVGDPVCSNNKELAKKTNYDASVKIIEAAKKKKIDNFVFVSTCSNYGKMKDNSKYIDEKGELNPVSLYAKLKVKIEEYILKNKKDNFCPTVLRFATAYGLCKNRMRFDLTVNEFTRDSIKKNKLLIYGEQFWRPYCHINDISEAILSVLNADKKKVAYEVFNVGSTNENYTKKMIAELLEKENPNLKIDYVQKNEDPRDYKVNFEKIKNVLNFTPKNKVIDGICEITEAIKNNKFEDIYSDIYRNVLD